MTEPADYWPPFGLSLTTPRLQLRPIRDADIPAAVSANQPRFQIGMEQFVKQMFSRFAPDRKPPR